MPNGHMETIVPSLFFKPELVQYERERLELSDGDFLDLDWVRGGFKRLIILSHGMEGSTSRHYMVRSADYFYHRDWDILAWNTRGCGGEMNRRLILTHHGFHVDLKEVIDHALTRDYDQIVLVGMSMGGSLSSKFLCEEEVDSRIAGAVCFSVTGDMKDMIDQVELKKNWIYKSSFLKQVKEKVRLMGEFHSGKVDMDLLEETKTFWDFHRNFTIPINQFKNLDDFYFQSSVNNYLPKLQKPTLIVNALNDPILGEACHPVSIANTTELLTLETPEKGGHLGFTVRKSKYSYMETRATEFIKETLGIDT